MTEEATAPADKRVEIKGQDNVLTMLVHGANQMEKAVTDGLWVTLTVRGVIMSGEVIPIWQWFDEQKEISGGDETVVGYLASLLVAEHERLTSLRQKVDNGEEISEEDQKTLDELPQFIHLRNAISFLPERVPVTGHYWRGRLSEVSGWSFGRLRDLDQTS